MIAVKEKRPQYRTELNSKLSKDKWGFIAKAQAEGLGDGNVRGWGDSD